MTKKERTQVQKLFNKLAEVSAVLREGGVSKNCREFFANEIDNVCAEVSNAITKR
jgi:hypothetical protein